MAQPTLTVAVQLMPMFAQSLTSVPVTTRSPSPALKLLPASVAPPGSAGIITALARMRLAAIARQLSRVPRRDMCMHFPLDARAAPSGGQGSRNPDLTLAPDVEA